MVDEPNDLSTAEGWANSPMAQGIAMARSGDQVGARAIFRGLIHRDPDDEDAWLWLAWVAESRAHSLRYLKEAQALLPDSQRIDEALAWASQDSTPIGVVGGSDRGSVVRGAPERVEQDGVGSGQARTGSARDMGRGSVPRLRDAMQRVKQRREAVQLPSVSYEWLRSLGMPVVSVLSVVALVLMVVLGIRLARNASPTVLALTLPTLVPNATATPSAEQLTEPIWVQVEIAMRQADWEAASESLERIRAIDPDCAKARSTLAEVLYQRGVMLVQSSDLEAGRVQFDRALRLDASYAPLQDIRRQLKLYNDGVAAYWAKDWPLAVQNLQRAYSVNPDFRDCEPMLAQSYYELAQERTEQDDWEGAKKALDASLKLEGDREDAQELMDTVMDVLIPPDRIVVDLSDQLVVVYEQHEVKYTYRCCTGRSDAPTVPGRYKIQSRMPMAYASKWDLDMPYWLGIYDAGGSENGFHALPLRGGSQVLWSNSMGTPCSFGCIVTETANAKQLYEWADIGTTVIVQR